MTSPAERVFETYIPIDYSDNHWAMPPVAARAAATSWLSRFAASCKHRITIACVATAWLVALYFAAQLVRGVL